MTNEEIDDIIFGIGSDSYNRFQVFIELIPKLKGKSYWYALRNAYDMADNLLKYSKIIKECFLKDEPQKEYLMTPEEIEYLKNLPEEITIYRGMSKEEFNQKTFGISWTLNKEVAEFFANNNLRNHHTNHLKKVVHEIRINKSEVIAFLNDRKEFEIIYIKHTHNDRL
jgi:hypothetical protein